MKPLFCRPRDGGTELETFDMYVWWRRISSGKDLLWDPGIEPAILHLSV